MVDDVKIAIFSVINAGVIANIVVCVHCLTGPGGKSARAKKQQKKG